MSELEVKGLMHDIKAKLRLGTKLTLREESFYLLLIASHAERYEYIKRKRGLKNDINAEPSRRQEK